MLGSTAFLERVITMKVEVDFSKCTGLGICESLAPDFFEVNDDGDLVLVKEDITDEELQAVEEAVSGCPTEALRILR
jgi:ferredoxin